MAISSLVQKTFQPLPEVRYSSRDFALMKESLSAWVQAHDSPYWNDLFESNIGVAFIDLISYLSDVMSFNMDKVANNSFIDTVERYRGMLHITNLLGYTPTAPVAARVPVRGAPTIPTLPVPKTLILRGAYFDTSTKSLVPPSSISVDNLNFELAYFKNDGGENLLDFPSVGLSDYKKVTVRYDGSSYKIDEDSQFPNTVFVGEYPLFWGVAYSFDSGKKCVYNDLTYASQQDGNVGHIPGDALDPGWWVVVPGESVYGLALLEGTSKADVFIPQPGVLFPSFVSSTGNVIEDSWVVFVNGTRWEQKSKNTLVLASPTEQVYTVQFTDQGNIKIIFGDGVTHGALPPAGLDVVLFYRVGGGVIGNSVIKGAISANVSGFIDLIDNQFTVDNKSTSGGFGGVDRESLDHIRYLAPGWFKTTERAITKNDFLVLALKYVSPTYGAVGKAAIVRPQNDSSTALQVPVKETSPGIFVVDIVAPDLTVNVYYPSYMCNVMLVYIWCPVYIDVNGNAASGSDVVSTKYLPPSSMSPSKNAIVLELEDYLNKGNYDNGSRQGDVGMTVVQTKVLEGFSDTVNVVIDSLIIDEKYDKVEVTNSIKKALYDLFSTFVPGDSLKKYLLYTVIGNTPGVISFNLKLYSVTWGNEIIDDTKDIYGVNYLFTLNDVYITLYVPSSP